MTLGSYKSFKPLQPLVPLPSVMDRYIAIELLLPFFFGVGAFSSVGVAVGAMFDLVRKVVESGLPMTVALNVFLFKLPYFIFWSFPMSTLFAALITYSRLSSDSELIALRSFGVSIYRLVLPAVVLSFIVTGVAFVFNEQVVPAANYQATLTLQQALKNKEPSFQQRNIVYPEYRQVKQSGENIKILTRLFYADQFDGQRMKGLTIVDRSQKGPDQIVVAESAMWNPLEDTWDFFNGTIYLVAPDSSYRNILRFAHQQLQLPRTPLDLAQQQSRDYDDMNIAQAQKQMELVRLSGDDQKIRKLKVRIQQKIAFPFVCVVFALVGAALGSKPQRTSRATSFGISVMVIFIYYLLQFIASAMGVIGIFSPLMSAWLPNLFGFASGGFLLLRTAR